MKIYSNSIQTGRLPDGREVTCFIAYDRDACARALGVRAAGPLPFTEGLPRNGGEGHYFALNAANAARMRQIFPWLNPAPLETDDRLSRERPLRDVGRPSFGFGDRLGLATPGHIHALRAAGEPGSIAPIFGQQSVRENARTGRTPQQVVDDAMWGVFQEGWTLAWGADADHLKHPDDLPPFVQAGYSWYTVDPGEHVDPAADTDSAETLQTKIAAQDWGALGVAPTTPAALIDAYCRFCAVAGLECDEAALPLEALRAAAKYGRAVLHITRMFRALQALKPGGFDFEASVDETETPTSVLEHFYIMNELGRLGVRVTSLAPRLPGRFEKGVDYIGDLHALEAELKRHTAVMEYFGTYKFSLHSGSDKFSVYPMLMRCAGQAVHVKTAGTSYLEALRAAARMDPALFRAAVELARERYPEDRRSYHVSAEVERIPDITGVEDAGLPALLDQFDLREALHVTYGSALAQFGPTLKGLLCTHPQAYEQVLLGHFRKHLEPLMV